MVGRVLVQDRKWYSGEQMIGGRGRSFRPGDHDWATAPVTAIPATIHHGLGIDPRTIETLANTTVAGEIPGSQALSPD